MITVEHTETHVQITIPKDAIPEDQLNSWLGRLRVEEIVQRSKLTEEEANRLAEEIKADWWAANKDRFLPPG